MEPIDPKREERKAGWESLKARTKKAVGSALGHEELVAAAELQQAEADARMAAAELEASASRARELAGERFDERQQILSGTNRHLEAREDLELEALEASRRAELAAIDEQARSRAAAAREIADADRAKVLQDQQVAAQEREAAGRKAAAQREAAEEARKIAADLDKIQENADQ